jgi:hypothetical protein
MLKFIYVRGNKCKIIPDIDANRFELDKIREAYKTDNSALVFAKKYQYSMNPFVYAISPLGSYNIGLTIELVETCKKLGIKTYIDNNLIKKINPNLFINKIEEVPNTGYKYRDYQLKLLKALIDNRKRYNNITNKIRKIINNSWIML